MREDPFVYNLSVETLGKCIFIRNDLYSETMTRMMNTEDAMVRKALIGLGWTPPKEKNNEY